MLDFPCSLLHVCGYCHNSVHPMQRIRVQNLWLELWLQHVPFEADLAGAEALLDILLVAEPGRLPTPSPVMLAAALDAFLCVCCNFHQIKYFQWSLF